MEAKDVTHDPVLPDVPDATAAVVPYCRDCLAPLPWDVAAIAVGDQQKVIDIGGMRQAFHPATGSEGSEVIACIHPAAPRPSPNFVRVVPCETCEGRGGGLESSDAGPYWSQCEACGGGGLVGVVTDDSDPSGRRVVAVTMSGLSAEDASTVAYIPRRSEAEKRATLMAWQNFQQMREITRPPEVSGGGA